MKKDMSRGLKLLQLSKRVVAAAVLPQLVVLKKTHRPLSLQQHSRRCCRSYLVHPTRERARKTVPRTKVTPTGTPNPEEAVGEMARWKMSRQGTEKKLNSISHRQHMYCRVYSAGYKVNRHWTSHKFPAPKLLGTMTATSYLATVILQLESLHVLAIDQILQCRRWKLQRRSADTMLHTNHRYASAYNN